MHREIETFNLNQDEGYREIAALLASTIDACLPKAESKIWHRHPVWFLHGNPTVGYSRQKTGFRLMFWSGADFGDTDLKPGTGKFKDASIFYNSVDEIDVAALKGWLETSRIIQWDYKNIYKRKGRLERIEHDGNN